MRSSRTILKHLILQEHVKQVLRRYRIRHPTRHLYIQILLSRTLTEHLLELVHQGLVLTLQIVYHPVLVLNVPLQLTDLVLVTVHLVFLDASQLLEFAFTGTLLALGLTSDELVVLLLFGLPSS